MLPSRLTHNLWDSLLKTHALTIELPPRQSLPSSLHGAANFQKFRILAAATAYRPCRVGLKTVSPKVKPDGFCLRAYRSCSCWWADALPIGKASLKDYPHLLRNYPWFPLQSAGRKASEWARRRRWLDVLPFEITEATTWLSTKWRTPCRNLDTFLNLHCSAVMVVCNSNTFIWEGWRQLNPLMIFQWKSED